MPRSTVPAKVEIFNLSPANNIRLLFAYTGLHEPEQPAPGVYALVVVRHGGTASLFQGQSRRGAVRRLNLALLIYRQNQRVLRRIEIYADNVVQLGGELRIVDDLEALDAVRLQPMSAPDAPHAGLRAGLAGHRTRGPVSGVGGRRLRGPGNRLGNRLRRDPGRASGARGILQQALEAELQKKSGRE